MDTVEPWYVSKDTPQCRVRYCFFYSNVMLSHILKKVEPWWFNHDLTSNMASLIFEVDLRTQAHVSDIRLVARSQQPEPLESLWPIKYVFYLYIHNGHHWVYQVLINLVRIKKKKIKLLVLLN